MDSRNFLKERIIVENNKLIFDIQRFDVKATYYVKDGSNVLRASAPQESDASDVMNTSDVTDVEYDGSKITLKSRPATSGSRSSLSKGIINQIISGVLPSFMLAKA